MTKEKHTFINEVKLPRDVTPSMPNNEKLIKSIISPTSYLDASIARCLVERDATQQAVEAALDAHQQAMRDEASANQAALDKLYKDNFCTPRLIPVDYDHIRRDHRVVDDVMAKALATMMVNMHSTDAKSAQPQDTPGVI